MSLTAPEAPPAQINATCLDLLFNEIVPLAIRTTTQTKKQKQSDDIAQPPTPKELLTTAISSLSLKDIDTGDITVFDHEHASSEDVNYRVEQYGFSIGLRLSELMIYHNSQNEILKDLELLNVMKFICRDVWKTLYGKQMDNLRTNHRGTFVLIDNAFKMLSRFDSPQGDDDTLKKCKTYLWIPSGVIRGVLKSFGINSLVTPEITKFPAVSFNIQTTIG